MPSVHCGYDKLVFWRIHSVMLLEKISKPQFQISYLCSTRNENDAFNTCDKPKTALKQLERTGHCRVYFIRLSMQFYIPVTLQNSM